MGICRAGTGGMIRIPYIVLNVVPDKKHIYKEYYVLCSRSRWREQNNMILMLFYVLPGVTHIIMFYVSFHVGRSICKVNVVWPNDFCSFVEGSVSINGAEFSICVLFLDEFN